jgi:hypothetical protein
MAVVQCHYGHRSTWPILHPGTLGHTRHSGNILEVIMEPETQHSFPVPSSAAALKQSRAPISGLRNEFHVLDAGSSADRVETCNAVLHSSRREEITYSCKNETEITVHMHQRVPRCLLQNWFRKSHSAVSKGSRLLHGKRQCIQAPVFSRNCILH